jgi:hypothetical protein
MMVVERKLAMWQRLIERYLIWEAAGCGATMGNITTLLPLAKDAVVVQLVRALDV